MLKMYGEVRRVAHTRRREFMTLRAIFEYVNLVFRISPSCVCCLFFLLLLLLLLFRTASFCLFLWLSVSCLALSLWASLRVSVSSLFSVLRACGIFIWPFFLFAPEIRNENRLIQ